MPNIGIQTMLLEVRVGILELLIGFCLRNEKLCINIIGLFRLRRYVSCSNLFFYVFNLIIKLIKIGS